MIVYNIDRKFFAMKGDADAYRKELGLKPDALIKLTITNREELATLLDGLCAIKREDVGVIGPGAQTVVIDVAPIPDCVPQFIRKSWERRNQ